MPFQFCFSPSFDFRCQVNSQSVRSRGKHRFWTGKEMLASLGYPCRAATANALGTDAWLGSYCSCFKQK